MGGSVLAVLGGLVAPLPAAGAAPAAAAGPVSATVQTLLGFVACGPVPLDHAHCGAQVVTNARVLAVEPHAGAAGPVGYRPADLQRAYGATAAAASAGGGRTIAVIGAFDDPNIEADLAVYRTTFGLPPCTSANGCFTKVNQIGGINRPVGDISWGFEHSLDVEMASAMCPNCRILLVEANSDRLGDLGTGVDTAARMGAVAISNSYGGPEMASELAADSRYYRHDGIAVVASAGDGGSIGAQYPAASPFVTAVGGTTLTAGGGARGWTESAWSDGGSGCSVFEPKPAWQHDRGCPRRTVADVSAVADPATGVAVYDTYGASAGIPLLCSLLGLFCPYGGWVVMGGTSASSPIVAGVYALAGVPVAGASTPYQHPGMLNDITTGSNGACRTYLCTAGAGYDGPTGLGTPQGTGAF